MKKMALVLIALGLAGCALLQPIPHQKLSFIKDEEHHFDCSEKDCKQAWERTQFWISRHSGMKIQIATDTLIETYNVTDDSPVYSFSASKEPLGNDSYRIGLDGHCGNVFGCSLSTEHVQEAFYKYLKTGEDILR